MPDLPDAPARAPGLEEYVTQAGLGRPTHGIRDGCAQEVSGPEGAELG